MIKRRMLNYHSLENKASKSQILRECQEEYIIPHESTRPISWYTVF